MDSGLLLHLYCSKSKAMALQCPALQCLPGLLTQQPGHLCCLHSCSSTPWGGLRTQAPALDACLEAGKAPGPHLRLEKLGRVVLSLRWTPHQQAWPHPLHRSHRSEARSLHAPWSAWHSGTNFSRLCAPSPEESKNLCLESVVPGGYPQVSLTQHEVRFQQKIRGGEQ